MADKKVKQIAKLEDRLAELQAEGKTTEEIRAIVVSEGLMTKDAAEAL